MCGSAPRLPEQRLIPAEAASNIGDADDRPGSLHRFLLKDLLLFQGPDSIGRRQPSMASYGPVESAGRIEVGSSEATDSDTRPIWPYLEARDDRHTADGTECCL